METKVYKNTWRQFEGAQNGAIVANLEESSEQRDQDSKAHCFYWALAHPTLGNHFHYYFGGVTMNIDQMMSSAYVLDLSRNFLNGSIPLSIGSICSLPFLHWLKLSSNNLLRELSFALQKCKGLTILDLGENRFYENIPKYIGQCFLSLSKLRIRDNMFSGNIPKQLCSLAHLHILDLAHNLSGSIPSCLGKLDALNSLISYRGHIPF
ncbi:hypothetical protein HYC85_008977 [Camellia sinensis]|uniref:Uncharacterized protein n=1 Tax=Camellia sinensis TaxID=4442 RepID=A0A7J7HV59_CAMSI|nr:hypothetical protein HYC85_008977 [Camellia sinensis]